MDIATIVNGSLLGGFRANRLPWMLLALLSLALSVTPVAADPINVPTSLNPGDQDRLAFLTSDLYTAFVNDITVYNANVTTTATSRAELAALPTQWKVIGSTLMRTGRSRR